VATIRKRRNADGRNWHVQIRRKGYATQTKSFPRKADAEVWAAGVEQQKQVGKFVDPAAANAMTFADALIRCEKERARARAARGGLSMQDKTRPAWQRARKEFAKQLEELGRI